MSITTTITDAEARVIGALNSDGYGPSNDYMSFHLYTAFSAHDPYDNAARATVRRLVRKGLIIEGHRVVENGRTWFQFLVDGGLQYTDGQYRCTPALFEAWGDWYRAGGFNVPGSEAMFG